MLRLVYIIYYSILYSTDSDNFVIAVFFDLRKRLIQLITKYYKNQIITKLEGSHKIEVWLTSYLCERNRITVTSGFTKEYLLV